MMPKIQSDLVVTSLLAPVLACVLAILLCRVLCRSSAAARHLVWLLAFVALAVCLPIGWFQLQLTLPVLPPKPIAPASMGLNTPQRDPTMFADPLSHQETRAPIDRQAVDGVTSLVPTRVTPAERPWPWWRIAGVVWAGGFLISLLLPLTGILRLRGMIRRARAVRDPSLAARWAGLSALSGLPSCPPLLVSSEVALPLVAGLFRPKVILPEAALAWPSPTLRMALVHELAHFGQHHLRWTAFARAVASFYWFHPLVWYALRRLQAEAEMAADDCVVVMEAKPVAYAEILVQLVREFRQGERFSFPTIGMLRQCGLEARVARILELTPYRSGPGRLSRLGVLAGTVLVAAGLLIIRPVAAVPPPASGGGNEKPSSPMLPLLPQELLMQAIGQNDVAGAEKALQAGADVNQESQYRHDGGYIAKSTALYFAAERGSLPLVRLLVSHGASIKPGKSTWTNPVDAALRNGFADVAKYLHEQGGTCDSLALAAALGDLETVKALSAAATAKVREDAAVVAAGCNQIDTLQQLVGEKGDPTKLFLRAASNGALDAMRYLAAHGLRLDQSGYDALTKAAYKGQAKAVALLLELGVKPNPTKPVANTALHLAAEIGSVEVVKLLLAAGADPNSLKTEEYEEGSTPLFDACTADNAEVARLLLDQGARLDIVNNGGFTPVLYAAYLHAPHCLGLFIDRGADIKVVNPRWKCGVMKFAMIFSGEDANRPDPDMVRVLIPRGMETVKVLLDKGVDVNATEEDGATPLAIAISNGQTACMEMLLQRGAKTNTADRYGATLLIRILTVPVKADWRLKVIERLFTYGVDPNIGIDNPNDSEYATPSALKAAIGLIPFAERRNLVNLLLAHGARFAVEKNSDTEKMLLAATTGDLATVQRLLADGISANAADRRGWTPLLSASALGEKEILHALVTAGADVNAHDASGFSALQFSVGTFPDHTEFHLLLDHGADLNYGSRYGHAVPIIQQAVMRDDPDFALELLQRGASPNRSPDNPTNFIEPLEQAVDKLTSDPKNERLQRLVQVLLHYGADPNLRRPNATSLLYFPVLNDNLEMTRYLLGLGIDPRKDPDGGKAVLEQAELHGSKEMQALIKGALEPKPASTR